MRSTNSFLLTKCRNGLSDLLRLDTDIGSLFQFRLKNRKEKNGDIWWDVNMKSTASPGGLVKMYVFHIITYPLPTYFQM